MNVFTRQQNSKGVRNQKKRSLKCCRYYNTLYRNIIYDLNFSSTERTCISYCVGSLVDKKTTRMVTQENKLQNILIPSFLLCPLVNES